MKYILKEIPENEKPRERLLKNGANSLADYELLAIILRTGTKEKSVLDVARDLTIKIENLNNLNDITYNELINFDGIGKVKALEILATIELGKRILTPNSKRKILDNPKDAYQYIKNKMIGLNQEILYVIYLTSKSEIINEKVITMGTINQTIIHPRDILKWALKYSAYAFILSHNHPSGDSTPSKQDLIMTEAVIEASKLVGVAFVDHLIIGNGEFYSYNSKKKFKN